MGTAQDIPKIVAALAEFIAVPEPYTIHFDPPLNLRSIVAGPLGLPMVPAWPTASTVEPNCFCGRWGP